MQRRVLIRARGLASFRRALLDLILDGDPLAARRRAVVLPTRASAELLRQTVEQQLVTGPRRGVLFPDLLTRDEWLARLHDALGDGRRWLTRAERLVLLDRAARETLARRHAATQPFQLRPGLIAAMLDFHDELRRRQRTVRRFARAIFDELRVERGTDRGSEGLINQTCFLGLTFLAYARGVAASGGVDEHALRAALIQAQPALPFDDLVIAVADHPADPQGLWPSDFDLVGRLTGFRHVRVVMTDEAHDAGFRDRLEQELPGIEETRAETIPRAPVIVAPAADASGAPVFVSRDREEEVRDVARAIRERTTASGGRMTGPVAVVFHRPLPYLYLAQQVLTDARVPYQAFDTLPLAAEPYAALLDVVMAVARTGGTRETTMALLRSSLLRCRVDGGPVELHEVAALEIILAERRATGDATSYLDEVESYVASRAGRGRAAGDSARRAARAAAIAHAALTPYRLAGTGSEQVRALSTFLRTHERPRARDDDGDDRPRRARAAVLSVLDTLADAFAQHDDRHREHDDLAAIIHHAIEAQTFMPRRGHAGVHLVDAVTARFGEFDDAYLVGLVETDWALYQRRSFFYANTLLKVLGWPQDVDLAAAQQAAFMDGLTLARTRTRLSAFQLEGDAVVGLSPLVDVARDLLSEADPGVPRQDLFPDEILTTGSVPAELDADIAVWLALRLARPPLSAPAYGGFVDPRPREVYRVSRVDRYVTCPFKYFSEHVLRLREDRDEDTGLTPIERGTLLHLLFERFYQAWQSAGRGAITPELVPEAVTVFKGIADEALSTLPGPDRILEELRLHGSMVAPGVAARVFELEAASGAGVRDRLLEYELNGPFQFPILNGLDARTIEIRGKTDRIDVLEDGSLRVVDYKLGRMPDLASSVQLAVYAHCARIALEQRDGRAHPLSAAMYLAFGDDRRFDGRLPGNGQELELAVMTRASDFAATVEKIESGVFPPSPKTTSECQWCGFSGVCRKEYRLEDDEATESV